MSMQGDVAQGDYVQGDSEHRSGWITFAALIMFAVSFVRLISAINYFGDGGELNDLTNSVFGNNLWAWGIWDLFLSALGIFAGLSLLRGGGFGRVVAYVWAVWVMVQSFLIISLSPWFGAAMITLAALVIYGLTSRPRWSETTR
jgi:hypothetical protein